MKSIGEKSLKFCLLVADSTDIKSTSDTVSVLGRDEGYNVKYSPLTKGVPVGECVYFLSRVLIQILYNLKESL